MALKRIAIVVAGSLAALVIAVVPGTAAFAQQGADDSSENTSSNSVSSSHDSDDDKSDDNNKDSSSGSSGGGSNSGSSDSGRQNKAEDSNSTTHKSGEAARTTLANDDSRRAGKLDAAKKKVCENRQDNIKTIMDRRVLWAERHIALFTTTSERTQKFYNEQGKDVSNYDALVAAANSAKATAQANLATLKSAATFDCNGDDPKALIAAYKSAFDAEKESLKAYRTAVKTLISGVKSVQVEDN